MKNIRTLKSFIFAYPAPPYLAFIVCLPSTKHCSWIISVNYPQNSGREASYNPTFADEEKEPK